MTGIAAGVNEIAQTLAVNNYNKAVGWANIDSSYSHAVLFENGSMTDLGTLGGSRSRAFAINNSGHIVGWSDSFIAGWRHAVQWDPYIRISSLR